jgi:phosphopantetheinyl transferase (holo-ACP synthase)
MISAGNDIVSLSAIDRQRTTQSRFYSKIISLSEKELYSQYGFLEMPFDHFVWLLWSIKESVYKYCRRIEPGLIFSPARIVVRQMERAPFYKGIVHSVAGILYSRSTVHADHISTVVSSNKDFGQVWSGSASIDRVDRAGQSALVRALALDKLSSLLTLDEEGLRIEKNPQGCPVIYKGDKELGIPVSLAHHGRFIAYSFRLEQETLCK